MRADAGAVSTRTVSSGSDFPSIRNVKIAMLPIPSSQSITTAPKSAIQSLSVRHALPVFGWDWTRDMGVDSEKWIVKSG